MAGLKVIKRRLVSIKNTRQITRAMKLVSAAKLSRAQEAVARSREYTAALNDVMKSLINEIDPSEITHPLMRSPTEVKNGLILVVGGGRGLCGAYNSNVNKGVETFLKNNKLRNVKFDSVIVGKKPAEYYRRVGYKFKKSYEKLPEDPNQWPLQEIAHDIEAGFLNGEYDEVHLVYTNFKSVMSQKVIVEKILPFNLSVNNALEVDSEKEQITPQTIFEPSRELVFNRIIPRLMRTRIQQAALESKASEHASRMTAMDAATKNAGELREKLQLQHNRLRQSKITSELLDILGGAQALN